MGLLMISVVIFVTIGLKSCCIVSFLGFSDMWAPKKVLGMSFPSGGKRI
jgi:hypothetical protein